MISQESYPKQHIGNFTIQVTNFGFWSFVNFNLHKDTLPNDKLSIIALSKVLFYSDLLMCTNVSIYVEQNDVLCTLLLPIK